ncbi:hypothetical protein GCM10009864_20050 [Streptomyces lunalinharesii]|uniref:Uncharacterized protein n=1 Tax=Streptomyces lunalinharesii TaxID=333384 RepID=A0ABN3RKJ5_9ACTN
MLSGLEGTEGARLREAPYSRLLLQRATLTPAGLGERQLLAPAERMSPMADTPCNCLDHGIARLG